MRRLSSQRLRLVRCQFVDTVVDQPRSARGDRWHPGNAVRRHRRVDRHAHAAVGRSVRGAARRNRRRPRLRRRRAGQGCSRRDGASRCADVAPLLRVDDTLAALHRLGGYARARFTGRLVAVTGSVGKTTTKEMLRDDPGAFGPTHAAVASYNNHWGVPLTLARMPPDSAFCVAEIGMNHRRRDRTAGASRAAACRGDHHGREGAYRLSRLDRGDRRREGLDPALAWSRAASRCCRPTRRCFPVCVPPPAKRDRDASAQRQGGCPADRHRGRRGRQRRHGCGRGRTDPFPR